MLSETNTRTISTTWFINIIPEIDLFIHLTAPQPDFYFLPQKTNDTPL